MTLSVVCEFISENRRNSDQPTTMTMAANPKKKVTDGGGPPMVSILLEQSLRADRTQITSCPRRRRFALAVCWMIHVPNNKLTDRSTPRLRGKCFSPHRVESNRPTNRERRVLVFHFLLLFLWEDLFRFFWTLTDSDRSLIVARWRILQPR